MPLTGTEPNLLKTNDVPTLMVGELIFYHCISQKGLRALQEHNATLLLIFRCVDQPSVTGNGKLISVFPSTKDIENLEKVNI